MRATSSAQKVLFSQLSDNPNVAAVIKSVNSNELLAIQSSNYIHEDCTRGRALETDIEIKLTTLRLQEDGGPQLKESRRGQEQTVEVITNC